MDAILRARNGQVTIKPTSDKGENFFVNHTTRWQSCPIDYLRMSYPEAQRFARAMEIKGLAVDLIFD